MTNLEIRIAENLRDSILIEKYRNGDLKAFGILTGFHRVELNYFNYSVLHNREDAEDATQEEFIILYDSLNNGKYIEHQVFGGWLKTAARYYLSHLQRKGKLLTIVINELPDPLINLFDSIDLNEEKLEIVLLAVKVLPERDVKLLNMRYWEKQSWKQIGDTFGITENSASGQHSKILNKLKAIIKILSTPN